MAEDNQGFPGRWAALKDVMRPWRAKIVVGGPIGAGLYQFVCDQFGFPTLPRLWGMTGSTFPWWAWLLLALAGSVYALFEYVRRNVGVTPASVEAGAVPEAEIRRVVSEMLSTLRPSAKAPPSAPAGRVDKLIAQDAELFKMLPYESFKNQVDAIERRLDGLRNRMGSGDAAMIIRGIHDQFSNMVRTIIDLGADEAEILQSVQEAETRIKADASYLMPDQSWSDGNSKREWHLLEARLNVYRELGNCLAPRVPDWVRAIEQRVTNR